MNIKIVIFAIISALLVTAIYSSSKPFVYGVTINCAYSKDKTKATCTVNDTDITRWACEKLKDGENWTCVQIKTVKEGSSSISPELRESIVKAQEAKIEAKIEQGNTTGGKTKDLGHLNDLRGLISNDDGSTENNDN